MIRQMAEKTSSAYLSVSENKLMAKQKIIKTGHSLAVTIPAHFVQSLGIKSGQEVEVEIESESGQIVYKFSGAKQLSLSQRFVKARKK